MAEQEKVNEKVEARIALARKRVASVLTRHGVAHLRTLEQKISDAGPTNQRIEPVLLTRAMTRMRDDGELLSLKDSDTKWFHLPGMQAAFIAERLATQRAVYLQVHNQEFAKHLGAALEVMVYRALLDYKLPTWGGFQKLDVPPGEHYKKIEPQTTYNERTCKSPVDFLALVAGEMLAIEVKNMREWVHPASAEVKKFLLKAVDLDMVPVLIARRIPYVTMQIFEPCGVLAHQTYNQRYPAGFDAIAAQAMHKDLLGYHDIRIGTEPDSRMRRFFSELLPSLVPKARPKFDQMKDLVGAFAKGEMSYKAFYTELQIRLGYWQRQESNDGSTEHKIHEVDEDVIGHILR